MRFNSLASILSVSLFAGIPSQVVCARSGSHILKPRRTSSILISPEPIPDVPTPQQANASAAAAGLNLTDIQGDILIGMHKNKELFFFFSISDVTTFKSKLASDIHPIITSTSQLIDVATQPITAVNIAFSQAGLIALGINDTDPLNDAFFAGGQFNDATNLGDPDPKTSGNWVPALAGTGIHGVFLLASDTVDNINAELSSIQNILGSSITEQHRLQGEARPGDQEGHEHFGFMDGISQPAVNGFTTTVNPGQIVIDEGHFLLGENGDSVTRPPWAKDGSFLAFRQMKQLVPEFNKFLSDNPISGNNFTAEEGSALLGARMMGRWKSGAPIDLAPLADDPVLANDTNRNNNFNFSDATDQSRCPFSAHIRKVQPRADFNPLEKTKRIIRASIPYGPEVTTDEATANTTSTERGLAFVSYQSNLNDGFRFIQQQWANSPSFMHGTGVDPIIGALQGANRTISGLDPFNQNSSITLITDFIVSRGGEYFFSPSLSAIISTLAA